MRLSMVWGACGTPRRRGAGWARTLRHVAAVVAVAGSGLGGVARAETVPSGTEVKVERVRPTRPKQATLRFLRSNIDFIRARFDRIAEKPVARRGQADAIDPRFLSYREMLAEIGAAGDSLAAAEDARQRQELLHSITELGSLEAQLDLLQRLLAEQRTRLGVLEADFTGDQRTALMVVLSGDPGAAPPAAITIRIDDGEPVALPLAADQLEYLKRGGVLDVFHGLVEPREQVVGIEVAGGAWPAGDAGFVTLDLVRDRLTLLRLDLSTARPEAGAASIRATAWIHDAEHPSSDRRASAP